MIAGPKSSLDRSNCTTTLNSEFLIVPPKQCYAAEVAVPIRRKIASWIFTNLLWDTSGAVRKGFWGGLWATRKLLVVVAGSALLTWWEWIEHHPPDLAIVELVHFFFVFAVTALLVYIGQRRNRNSKKSLSELGRPR